jgi:hypothetical protein
LDYILSCVENVIYFIKIMTMTLGYFKKELKLKFIFQFKEKIQCLKDKIKQGVMQ